MYEIALILVLCVLIAVLFWLKRKQDRWCGSCRYYSRNTFPVICEACAACDKWAPAEKEADQ